MRRSNIACVIPTYNGEESIKDLLDSISRQSIKADILVVDSSSKDSTLEIAALYATEVVTISSSEFNHGGTRQLMVEKFPNYEFFVFLTQDAILEGCDALKNLLLGFDDNGVGAVCGRQLPHKNANFFATHARLFNYPNETSVKSKSDIPKFGIKTAFLSNSFAGYRASALASVGGFPRHVILAEDMYVAAKLILAGYKIVYAATAECRHSHNYSVIEEFRRYFDTGVFHSREPWILKHFGSASGEGVKFVTSEFRSLKLRRSYLLPASIIRTAAKLVGFKLGTKESKIPVRIKKKLSMHKKFWLI